MAKNDTNSKPTFVASGPLTALPTRKPPEKEIDLETANAILALISQNVEVNGEQVPQTASDGVSYADAKSARAEANKASRLVKHVLPDGKATKTRVYETAKGSGKYAWAVWLTDAKAEDAPAK